MLLFGLVMINSFPAPVQLPDLVLDFANLNQPLLVPVNKVWKNSSTNYTLFNDFPNAGLTVWNNDCW